MILVAGATGVLGSEIVRRLKTRFPGRAVRALTRDTSTPEKVAQLEQLGVEIVRGDLKDRASLDAACRNVEVVISTVTMILTGKPGDSFADTDGAGNVNLVNAARAAGVRHFLFVSFDTGRVPDSPLTQAKKDVEARLVGSGMSYTILQPGLFMESWLGPFLFADPVAGTAKIYGHGTDGIRYVAVGDVAEVAVQSLQLEEARKAIIPFGGPEPLSQRDAVRLFEEAYGKPFTVTEIPEAALEAQWKGASDAFEKTFSALMLGVARGLGTDAGPPRGLTLQMTTPREFVARLAAQQPAGAAH